MTFLDESQIYCPYCAQVIEIDLDASAGNQEYIEDCQVCCHPIKIRVIFNRGKSPTIIVTKENE